MPKNYLGNLILPQIPKHNTHLAKTTFKLTVAYLWKTGIPENDPPYCTSSINSQGFFVQIFKTVHNGLFVCVSCYRVPFSVCFGVSEMGSIFMGIFNKGKLIFWSNYNLIDIIF